MSETTIGDLRFRVWEGGTGPALLFLHGFQHHPGDAPFLRALAERRTVLAPEHPGFGPSDLALDSIHDVIDLVLHLRRLIESRTDGPIDVVGHCLGGMFGAELAALCPHLVRRLVLVNPYGLWLDSDPLPDPFTLSPAALARAKWRNPEGIDEPAADVCADRNDTRLLRYHNDGAATRWLWPIPERGLRRRIGAIHAPTLVVHGDADGLIPVTYAKEFVELIPDARLELIADVGHLPMVEALDEFMKRVDHFLG